MFSSYQYPVPYAGSANLTQIYSNVNATHWTLVYRCQNCLLFDDPSQETFNASTSKGTFLQGWAQSFVVQVASATQASYSLWATKTATGPVATGSTTATATVSAIPVPTADAYDYIVVGAGAGGIPMADKLSASGASVLLVEKGFASSGRWGGTLRPENHWLDGTNLTWFDIPGECNRIWNGGTAGVVCTDTDQYVYLITNIHTCEECLKSYRTLTK
jgi:cellobiose dehydrogenase (acceptor)